MNVSADALRTVKDALGTFKTDIKGIGSTANTHSQACLKSCREKLRKVAERINQLESKEAQLTLRIQQLDVKIESYQQKQNEIENRIPQTEYKIEGLYSQQETLMNRLNELQSRLSGTEDEDERAKIQAQIAQVQEQLNYVKNLLRETKEALSKLKEQKETILAEISRMSSKKNDNENELSIVRRKLLQYQQQKERMATIYRNVESDSEAYLQAVRQFETISAEKTESNYQVADLCINIIEEMEAIL